GLQIEYPSITLIVVSRVESGPSICCQLNNDGARDTWKLSILPQNIKSRTSERIFDALSRCAAPGKGTALEDTELGDTFIDSDSAAFEPFAVRDIRASTREAGCAVLSGSSWIIMGDIL
ncbi:hypothetical protein B0H13DRAFT_1625943, partial [Mycena leptocephala]